MKLWRYRAIQIRPPGPNSSSIGGAAAVESKTYVGGLTSGELAGECAADVRYALRRIGLQVVELQALRSASSASESKSIARAMLHRLGSAVRNYLRKRRTAKRAEFYDSLATMLHSGLPLLEAMETIISALGPRMERRGGGWGRGGWHTMLVQVREQLRSGSSFSAALEEHDGWFDRPGIAMIEAGQHGGNLAKVLANLAERHERSGELSGKLISALAYPTIVTMVGIGVVVFLSVKTLPDLTSILTGADIDIPPLTSAVMGTGQFIASYFLLIALGLVVVPFVVLLAIQQWLQRRGSFPHVLRRCYPKLLRRLAVASFAQQLAELKQSGVPIVESLRVLAPPSVAEDSGRAGSGMVRIGLGGVIRIAAERIERGEELSQALDDELWFDAEFRRLLDIGQASGEIEELLFRIAERYTRQSRRLIDRLAAMLEPVVLLVLASLVGVVVMAAILPLIRLREIL